MRATCNQTVSIMVPKHDNTNAEGDVDILKEAGIYFFRSQDRRGGLRGCGGTAAVLRQDPGRAVQERRDPHVPGAELHVQTPAQRHRPGEEGEDSPGV